MSFSTWIKNLRGDRKVVQRGLSLIADGDLVSAKQVLREGDEFFPGNSVIKYHLAYCLVMQRDFEPAVAALRDGGLRHAKPENLENVFCWCNSMVVAKQYAPAIALYNLIIEAFPGAKAAQAYCHVARIHHLANRTQKGVECLIRSLEHAVYPETLAMMLNKLRSEEESLALSAQLPRLIEVSRLEGRHMLNVVIADIYQRNFDFDSASKFISDTRDIVKWKGKRRVSGEVRLPGYLIIGTVKSGTSSMFETLGKHPQIFNTFRKEIHFFDNAAASTLWYRSHFPRLPADFHAVTGEASPNYLYHDCMDKVKEVLPNVKLICMLREPADRAISQYYHTLRLGYRCLEIEDFFDVGPFETLNRKTDQEIEDHLFKMYTDEGSGNRAISSSYYYYFLRRWFRKFDSSNLLLVNFDDYCREPQSTLSQICDFLEVSPFEFKELGPSYPGNYDASNPKLDDLRQRLRGLFAEPNRLLREEFGVEFNTGRS